MIIGIGFLSTADRGDRLARSSRMDSAEEESELAEVLATLKRVEERLERVESRLERAPDA